MTRKQAIPRKQFEQLQGKLRHACIGIPAGKGPDGSHRCRGAKRLIQHIRDNNRLCDTLQKFSTLIKVLGKCPSHWRELVVDGPGDIG
jgi:hypothetical protein